MQIEHSKYWERKKAIARVPSTGRKLKVVYRRKGKNNIEVITSYWLD